MKDRPVTLESQLKSLRTLDRTALSIRYLQLYEKPISDSVPRDLVEAAVGYRLQKQLIARLQHRLNQVLTAGEAIIDAAAVSHERSLLIRIWRGRAYAVTVLSDVEIIYQGLTYHSLEAVAQEITRGQRSAEQFFGEGVSVPSAKRASHGSRRSKAR